MSVSSKLALVSSLVLTGGTAIADYIGLRGVVNQVIAQSLSYDSGMISFIMATIGIPIEVSGQYVADLSESDSATEIVNKILPQVNRNFQMAHAKIDGEFKAVDLDYSKILNSLSFGRTAAKRTERLYNLISAQRILYDLEYQETSILLARLNCVK